MHKNVNNLSACRVCQLRFAGIWFSVLCICFITYVFDSPLYSLWFGHLAIAGIVFFYKVILSKLHKPVYLCNIFCFSTNNNPLCSSSWFPLCVTLLVYGMNLNLNMLISSAEFIHHQEHSGDVSRGDDIRWYVFLDVLSLYGCYLGQVSIKKGFWCQWDFRVKQSLL